MDEDVTRDARSRRRTQVVRGVLVAGFGLAALHRISRPGPLYDEVLFVNAALGGVDPNFVHARRLGVPVMLMSYLGALKSWLHAPVFALFGVSIETVRVPSVLIACATISILSRLGERLLGRCAGLLLTLVLVTDPSFLMTARVDYGPVVLAGLLKAAAVALALGWLERPSAARAWAVLAVLALGVFDKLNFVWFVLALGGAVLLVEPRRLWAALRAEGPAVWLPVTAGAGLLLYVGTEIMLPLLRGPGPGGDFPTTTLAERARGLPTLVRATLDGSAWWRIAFRTVPPARPEWAALEIAGLVVAASCAALSPVLRSGRDEETRRLARLAALFAVLCALLFAQLVATPHAGGPHHAAMLHPWPVFALFAAGAALVEAVPPALRRRAGVGASLLVLLVVGGQVRFDAAYLAQLRDRGAIQSWASTAIYGLSRDLERLDPDFVVSADWGLHNQLFSLAPPASRLRYRNLYPFLQEASDSDLANGELATALRAGKKVAVVLHPEGETMMRRARERVLAFVAALPADAVARWPVTDASGHTVYEVILLEPPGVR